MKAITKEQIIFDLQLGGIQKGDVILMQGGPSAIGHVEGGADTVIDAVLETIGSEGT